MQCPHAGHEPGPLDSWLVKRTSHEVTAPPKDILEGLTINDNLMQFRVAGYSRFSQTVNKYLTARTQSKKSR